MILSKAYDSGYHRAIMEDLEESDKEIRKFLEAIKLQKRFASRAMFLLIPLNLRHFVRENVRFCAVAILILSIYSLVVHKRFFHG